MPQVRITKSAMCGSRCMGSWFPVAGRLIAAPPGMRMRLEVQLPTPPIGYVRVQLGCGEIRMAEHFLHRPEVGASLQEMRGERVAQEMWMDALRVQAGLRCEPPEDQERALARQGTAPRVEEELRPVARVEERPAA